MIIDAAESGIVSMYMIPFQRESLCHGYRFKILITRLARGVIWDDRFSTACSFRLRVDPSAFRAIQRRRRQSGDLDLLFAQVVLRGLSSL
jgi:hypothetical protein